MAKAKKFEFDAIKENGVAILAENGVACFNKVSLPMLDEETGKQVGNATAIYDGLAVLTAVNTELFENVHKSAKQVIAEKSLLLKINSVIEIDGKEYLVIEVKEIGFVYVALIQAA